MVSLVTAKTAGYCFGVKRAVGIALDAAEKYGHVCTLGELIHNTDAVRELEQHGVTAADDLAECSGAVVIRSHGVGRKVYDDIAALGLECIDATCPFVARIHKIAAHNSAAGSDVLILGDAHHPEVLGIVGHVSTE